MPETARRRRLGLRPRITLLAVAIVGVALSLGAVAFWFVLRGALVGQLEAAAAQDAAQYAEILDDGASTESLPDVDDEAFWQVIDRDTESVIGASDAAEDVGALAGKDAAAPPSVVLEPGDPAFVTATEDDGDLVVVVGRSSGPVENTLGTVALLLAVSVPVIVGVVAVTTWLAVGRSLAPVDRMRRQVDGISGSDLTRRVDDPGTGDELSSLGRTMNALLDRLGAAQATQRRFVSDASHELKSPLASMRQYAEVAAAYPDRVSQAELADVVLEEGARLEALVAGMLVLTRADEGALSPRRGEIDIAALLSAEHERIAALGRLTVDMDPRAARIVGDRALIAQAVRNLVDNAARHARSRLRLAAVSHDDSVFVTVDDDGPGIPESDRERVFERFVRLDDARSRDAGGSGLGLAIVREIAHSHGGDVRADASPLGGARVTLRLPA